MKQECHGILSSIHRDTGENPPEILELYPGIELSFLSASGKDAFHVCHAPLPQMLEINYCISGRMGWDMGNGNRIYLGPGNFSLNTMDVCGNSAITLPNGSYEGITVYINLERLSTQPPEPLAGAPVTGEALREKYCEDGTCTALAGNETIQQIFLGLYVPPKEMRLAWQKIKVLELLLVLSQMEAGKEKHLTEYRAEQVKIIRQIHDQLTDHLEQRFSIESLSKQYLMNPTTLKQLFKAVYGTSIAAHIREHRMAYAARLV